MFNEFALLLFGPSILLGLAALLAIGIEFSRWVRE